MSKDQASPAKSLRPAPRAPARRPGPPAAAAVASPWGSPEQRARERELKREAVILAAARAFRDRGYHHTSLDDVATTLNVTKPTIYSYVRGKEELLFECFRAGVERIHAAFRDAEGLEASGRERLLAAARGYAVAITSEFGSCMVRVEDQDLSPAMSAKIKAMKSEVDQSLRRLIRQGVADGSIRGCDVKMTAFALAGALNWIALWHRADARLPPDEIASRLLEVFELGLAPRAG